MNVTPQEIREIAREVASETVDQLFLALGVNTSDHNEIPKLQKDLAHLRRWRETTESLPGYGLKAAVTFFVTASLGALVYGIRWHWS